MSKTNLYQKILAVQKKAEAVPKSGYNSFNKYAYATEADVLKVKDLMNEHGLIAFPSVIGFETYNRGESVGVIQHIKYTVVDAETGESIECMVLGQGEDKGDKGAYKGSTGGNKYFYLKFIGVPTGDDPERDEQPGKNSQPQNQQNRQGQQGNRQGQQGNRQGQQRQQQPAPPRQQQPSKPNPPIQAGSPEDEIRQGQLEQIKKLASIPKLSGMQILKVVGVSLTKATVDELQVAKEKMTAFVNRFNNKQLTEQDQAILSTPAEQRAS